MMNRFDAVVQILILSKSQIEQRGRSFLEDALFRPIGEFVSSNLSGLYFPLLG